MLEKGSRQDKRDVFAPGGALTLAVNLNSTNAEMIRSAQVKVVAWALAHEITMSDMFEVMRTLGIHPDQLKNGTGLQQ